MVQTSHDHNWVLQNTIDFTYDLNQQTYVVFGQLQAQQEAPSITMEINDGENKGQRCVNNSQGNAENSHEASADVVPLQNHQGPVQHALPSQIKQNEVDGVIHDVYSI
ncbi:hypothetical protein EXN66_Car014463 [Channa argus]|uniref:Uncharacterized protein n=1 Tax=Channa argus TaxID=215402 RepID=A0A6G1Q9D7_CHAAH|nr:hypothetical protein EXN66_Car014463 [Channa argus]